MKKIFVYGTLKKGFWNHYIFGFSHNSKFLYKMKVLGMELYLHPNKYPVAVKINNNMNHIIISLV